MFYTTQKNDHGFPYDPFKAIVTPRPIGWIGSIDKDGVANLAPHSYFNAISDNPYFVIFGSVTYKDTVRNIEDTGDFTCSLVSEDMFDAMNSSSVPVEPKVDEFNLAGIKKQESKAKVRREQNMKKLKYRGWPVVDAMNFGTNCHGDHVNDGV